MGTHLGENQLLARLPKASYANLFSQARTVPLKMGQVLYESRGPIEYSYFPTTGSVSAVAVLSDGDIIEVATVGNEGAVGLPPLVGANTSPNRVFVQVPGEALRIEATLLDKAAQAEGPLKKLLTMYHAAFLFQASQSVACNGLHVLEKRCCRWMLMTHDRVAGDILPLTHELLSVMLGVRRPSVTEVLQELKDQGLITYTRGKITIIDRKGLEAGSCECYQAVRDEYDRLLGKHKG